ncbi:hypothetical protein ACFC09_41075 [Streptomyces sp. NPDC056161]|uniref:hypothetical protein n=1 Tax=Streptomyces sp. NPDC056161 TaxID=3345732 RepID=UPI0035DA140E
MPRRVITDDHVEALLGKPGNKLPKPGQSDTVEVNGKSETFVFIDWFRFQKNTGRNNSYQATLVSKLGKYGLKAVWNDDREGWFLHDITQRDKPMERDVRAIPSKAVTAFLANLKAGEIPESGVASTVIMGGVECAFDLRRWIEFQQSALRGDKYPEDLAAALAKHGLKDVLSPESKKYRLEGNLFKKGEGGDLTVNSSPARTLLARKGGTHLAGQGNGKRRRREQVAESSRAPQTEEKSSPNSLVATYAQLSPESRHPAVADTRNDIGSPLDPSHVPGEKLPVHGEQISAETDPLPWIPAGSHFGVGAFSSLHSQFDYSPVVADPQQDAWSYFGPSGAPGGSSADLDRQVLDATATPLQLPEIHGGRLGVDLGQAAQYDAQAVMINAQYGVDFDPFVGYSPEESQDPSWSVGSVGDQVDSVGDLTRSAYGPTGSAYELTSEYGQAVMDYAQTGAPQSPIVFSPALAHQLPLDGGGRSWAQGTGGHGTDRPRQVSPQGNWNGSGNGQQERPPSR